MMPLELYVAPDTTSTLSDCLSMMLSVTFFSACSKYHGSSSSDFASIEVIFPSLIVTVTVMSPS